MTTSAHPDIAIERSRLEPFYTAVESVLVGQRALIDGLLIGLLTDGHVLLEGVPGLAKTLAVRAVAKTLDLAYQRIQFTPDLLPADVIGTQIYNAKSGEFTVKAGPVFANVVLADEINRAPAKVQSALLEAMQERQVTLGDTTHALPSPFFVLATQNPLEQEGTYPLPEAQLDRFLMKLKVDYPSKDEELRILDRRGGIAAETEIAPVLTAAELSHLRGVVDAIHVDPRVKAYMVDVVRATREPNALIQTGASPRGSLSLLKAAKANAFLQGRHFVSPDDVKQMAKSVLRHRVVPSFEAEAEEMSSDAIIQRILDGLPVP
ncbi:AAA family ATPase [soil metagenome]